MKNSTLLAVGVIIGLLASAVILLISAPMGGKPIELLPTSTLPALTIHVSGAVANPGVLSLPPGSRLNDAIHLAGGLMPDAILTTINLAARLQDGQKVHIPTEFDLSFQQSLSSQTDPGGLSQPININMADVNELTKLPGIGTVRAADIVAFRQNNGLFDKIEDIQNVPGIGPVMFEKIKPWITITN